MSGSRASLRTLLFTDLVDSTRLIERLGDARAAEVFARHDRLARSLLDRSGGREIDKTDGFLLLFDRPIHAVSYALSYHQALEKIETELHVPLRARAAVHIGEVILRENPSDEVARGAKPIEVEGIAKPLTARLMGLAGAGQTLLSRSAFDLARRAAADEPGFGEHLRWLAHGSYLLKGIEDPVDVYEVGVDGHAPLVAPTPSDKAKRLSTEGTLLGWRPAPGLDVPHRPHWVFEKKLGEGGFGEVWLARHRKTHDARVLKFCFEIERVRALQREVTLCRVLRESLGNRPDIARILDWNFEEPPYFLEFEHTEGGNLHEWVDRQGGFAKVPMATRLELVAQAAEAIAAAHSVGVLHKDVKPANLLVATAEDGKPRIQVTDFGIGLLTDRGKLEGLGITALGMTVTATTSGSGASGTRIYMAPEVLEGKPATTQADIYALGVLTYQMVVGDLSRALAPGWERDVADEILREDVAAFVEGRPDRRLASAAEVAHRLRALDERRARRDADADARRSMEASREALARNRLRFRVVSAASVVALVVAILVAVQARRAAREADRANREAVISGRVTDFLLSIFQVSDPSEARGSSVTARGDPRPRRRADRSRACGPALCARSS
ncbi:MAG: protein kinase [Acidobacteriota bacterium]